jgi:predicted Zn-dependent protease DUF2268
MLLKLVPLDAGHEFAPGRLDSIVGWLEGAARDVVLPLRAECIDVLVVPGTNLIPDWDCNGYTHGAWRITITVDPECDGKEKRPLDGQLRAMLAHELHHAMRSRGPGYGSTLGEALVTEGLAQCYEEQVGCPTPNYAVAVRGRALAKLARLAKDELWSDAYDHSKWFFGSKTEAAFPWSGGYSLGYVLMRPWLDHAGLSASAAVSVAAREILPAAFDLAAAADFDSANAAPESGAGDRHAPARAPSMLRRLLWWR